MAFFNKGLLLILLALSGCTYNPFLKDNQTTGTVQGTAIGAVIGGGGTALLGAPKPVIIGGTVLGGSIGYYASTLRYAAGGVLQAGGVVYQQGDFITIEVPTDNLFDPNTDDFLPNTTPILNSINAVIARYPNDNVMISGNTSGFASAKFERKLSEDRARQIANYIWVQGVTSFQNPDQGMHMRRLIYVGYGPYFPIANDIKLKGIRANSRIQITLYPPNRQIHSCRYKVFKNVGGLDEPQPKLTEKQPVDFNAIFPPGAPPGEMYKEQHAMEDGVYYSPQDPNNPYVRRKCRARCVPCVNQG